MGNRTDYIVLDTATITRLINISSLHVKRTQVNTLLSYFFFVIGIVVAMAAGVVITGSTLPAVSAQGNMTAGGGGNMTAGGGGNMTAGGGDIVQQLKSAAVAAELIDNKKMFIVACEPSMTDPDTQCVVANLEMR